MEDVKRVFFHELGHFIAHEINLRYYNGVGTKSIEIFPCVGKEDIFCGDAKINLSDDEKEKRHPTKEMLPEYLASSTYGCLLQSYYKGETLKECFKINGGDDQQQWHGALHAHKLVDFNSEVSTVENEYFVLLKEKGELDNLMKLDPLDYLESEDNQNYEVKIDKLREDLSPFIDKHKDVYEGLIKRYRVIIDDYT